MVGMKGRSGGNRHLKGDFTAQTGLPIPPIGKKENFYSRWNELVGMIEPSILRPVDSVQLTVLVDLLVEIDELGVMLNSDADNLKIRSLRLRLSQQVSRLSAQFGLSPMDRQRISVEQNDEPEDPFETLAYQMRGTG